MYVAVSIALCYFVFSISIYSVEYAFFLFAITLASACLQWRGMCLDTVTKSSLW